MRKCKCIVLEPISNGLVRFEKGDIVGVQFYQSRRIVNKCAVWEIKDIWGNYRGCVSMVDTSKVMKYKDAITEKTKLKNLSQVMRDKVLIDFHGLNYEAILNASIKQLVESGYIVAKTFITKINN